MRLWSLHPKYLDAKGLVALWREALLAKKILAGKTRGYTHHPQLIRFKRHRHPIALINNYLSAVFIEATERGYSFNVRKIGKQSRTSRVQVTTGQLRYELEHLKRKLLRRDRRKYGELAKLKTPQVHPLFIPVPGKIETWEKID